MTDKHTTDGDKILDDHVILITGAGGGIGSHVARAAAAAGAECILLGRQTEHLNVVYDTIVADGNHEPALFPLDLTKAADIDYQRLADGIETDCGRLDGIVHLATRFEGLMPLASHSVEEWRRIMHINVTAAFALTRACLPLLGETGDTSVLFAVDQAAACKAFWGAYAASKAALMSLTRVLALEHSGSNTLRVNAIDPGPRATGLRKAAFPLDDPAARPAEAIAPLFVQCLSAASRGTTGHVFDADGNKRAIGEPLAG